MNYVNNLFWDSMYDFFIYVIVMSSPLSYDLFYDVLGLLTISCVFTVCFFFSPE